VTGAAAGGAMMARTLTIIVPYPRPALGPNGRGVWQAKARLVRSARVQATWAAWRARGEPRGPRDEQPPLFAGPVRVDALVRLGKGRKRMDEDGFWGCMKAALDGLTDAGVWRDDRRAVLGTVIYAGERIAGDGEVELTLTGLG
jgi:hypothetical protein